MEVEELGRSSVLDIRPADKVQQISGYMRSKMTGSNPPAPIPTEKCRRCKGNHPKENRCPEWTNKLRCDLCTRRGHVASNCDKKKVLKCYLCKKIGHTSARCRLCSSDIDKEVKVGDHNAIEAEVAAEAQLMNISQRSHTSPTLAPKRGGARGGSGLVSSTFLWAPRWREPSPWTESLRLTPHTFQ